MWIRSLLFTTLFSACYSPCQAAPGPPKYLNTWGGLDIYHDSGKIRDTDASNLSNVLTDRGYLEIRPGSVLFQTLLEDYSIKYLKEFVSPAKTRYIIAHSSTNKVYRSDTSAAFTELSTTTAGYNLDCVSAFGRLYCADGFAPPWYWDGTSTGPVIGIPICTFLEFAHERLYCANTNVNDSNVNASRFGNASSWAVPTHNLAADDAMYWTYQRRDGEGITCFKLTPWGIFIGKYHSTHIHKGYDNNTYYKVLIDPNIGCVDDRSVQMVDGVLMWMGLEGVYAWAGAGRPILVSLDVDPDMKAIRQLSSNKASWVISSEAEFEGGKLDVSGPGASVDAGIFPGFITPSSWTVVETSSSDFEAGTLVYTDADDDSVVITTEVYSSLFYDDWDSGIWTNETSAGGDVYGTGNLYFIIDSKADWAYTWTPQTELKSCWSFKRIFKLREPDFDYYFMASSSDIATFNGYSLFLDQSAGAETWTYSIKRWTNGVPTLLVSTATYWPDVVTDFRICRDHTSGSIIVYRNDPPNIDTILLSATDTTYNSTAFLGAALVTGDIGGTIIMSISNMFYSPSTGTIVSQKFNTHISTPIGGPFSVSSSIPSGTAISYDVRDASTTYGSWGAWQATSDTLKITLAKQWWQYRARLSDSALAITPQLHDVTLVARTTCVYHSAVKYIGADISNWLTFDSNHGLDGGLLDYYVRTASFAFTVDAVAPAWISQINHIQVVASTNTYYQWRSDFLGPSGSNTIKIADVTTNWQEGTDVPMASMVWDHRYHLCVLQSSTALTNDRCWVYQQNKRWTHFDGPSYASLTLFDNQPLAGDGGTSGKIWKIMQDGVWQDDGKPIDAFWETPDFIFDSPGQNKVFRAMWIDAAYHSGSKLDIGYVVNRGTVFTSTNTALDSTLNYVCKRIDSFPASGYAVGRYLRFRFGRNSLDEYFRLNTATIYYDIEPLKPD